MVQQPMADPKAERFAWGRVASTTALLNSEEKKADEEKQNEKQPLINTTNIKPGVLSQCIHICIMLPVATALEWNSL